MLEVAERARVVAVGRKKGEVEREREGEEKEDKRQGIRSGGGKKGQVSTSKFENSGDLKNDSVKC